MKKRVRSFIAQWKSIIPHGFSEALLCTHPLIDRLIMSAHSHRGSHASALGSIHTSSKRLKLGADPCRHTRICETCRRESPARRSASNRPPWTPTWVCRRRPRNQDSMFKIDFPPRLAQETKKRKGQENACS